MLSGFLTVFLNCGAQTRTNPAVSLPAFLLIPNSGFRNFHLQSWAQWFFLVCKQHNKLNISGSGGKKIATVALPSLLPRLKFQASDRDAPQCFWGPLIAIVLAWMGYVWFLKAFWNSSTGAILLSKAEILFWHKNSLVAQNHRVKEKFSSFSEVWKCFVPLDFISLPLLLWSSNCCKFEH